MTNQLEKITLSEYALNIFSTVIFLITSIGNICAALSISSFKKIFLDVFHWAPLEGSTEFLLRFGIVFVILSFIWPVLGFAALYMKNQIRLSSILYATAQAAILLQCSFTIFALYHPFLGRMSILEDASNLP